MLYKREADRTDVSMNERTSFYEVMWLFALDGINAMLSEGVHRGSQSPTAIGQ